jgi:hypothetical protein
VAAAEEGDRADRFVGVAGAAVGIEPYLQDHARSAVRLHVLEVCR